jgi:DNA-binding transcriptional LysR family regulator
MSSTDNVSLRQLRYFVAAAETGRFSMAATRAHVSQSAITNAVLLLEQELGVRLFERKPHGVALTADGQRFYHRTRGILDSLADCLREQHLPALQLTGPLRIGASYTLLGYFLPPLLARFRDQYPDVAIDLADMHRQAIEDGVEDGSIDVGVVILSNIPERERFGHHVLVRSRRQLWLAADHPLLAKDNAALADIAAYPYIQVTVDESEESTGRYWQARGVRPHVAFRTTSMEALRGLIAHGFGVSILSDMVYRHWSLEGKKIEARPILDVVPDMEVGLIWHRDRPLAQPAEAFRQFLLRTSGN